MTKRIEYIDAMRGFTMFLVVLQHIETFGYKGLDINSFNNIFILFRMPLFFFISGFILYKKDFIWDFTNIKRFISKKIKIQIIPTVVFLSLFLLFFKLPLAAAMFSPNKDGYWFTIALLEFFIIHSITMYIVYKLKIKNNITEDIILIILSIIIYLLHFLHYMELSHLNYLTNLIGIQNFQFYIFFTLGILTKKHFNGFCKIIDNGYILGIIIFIFALNVFYCINIYENNIYLYKNLKIPAAILGITITFAFFRKYESAFTKEHKLGKVLQFIGKRTLDVYLIHYFFLPRNLKVIGEFFYNNSNPIVEFFITSIFALMVIGACLVTSSIIRISPIAGHYLFGVKKEITGNNILEKNNENVIK